MFRLGRTGNTVVLASISGPVEVRLAAEQPSQATFEVLVRPLSNVPSTESKSQAAVIRAALTPSLILTKNPRTLVQLVIQNLSTGTAAPISPRLAVAGVEQDGHIAAMINASSMALLNAGSTPMKGVVCAVSIGRSSNDGLIVDPTSEEVITNGILESGCFAFMFVGIDKEPACVWTNWRRCDGSGGFSQESLEAAKSTAKTATSRVYGRIRSSLDRSNAIET